MGVSDEMEDFERLLANRRQIERWNNEKYEKMEGVRISKRKQKEVAEYDHRYRFSVPMIIVQTTSLRSYGSFIDMINVA